MARLQHVIAFGSLFKKVAPTRVVFIAPAPTAFAMSQGTPVDLSIWGWKNLKNPTFLGAFRASKPHSYGCKF